LTGFRVYHAGFHCHEVKAKLPLLLERVGVRRIKAFDSPHPNLLPEGEGIALNST